MDEWNFPCCHKSSLFHHRSFVLPGWAVYLLADDRRRLLEDQPPGSMT